MPPGDKRAALRLLVAALLREALVEKAALAKPAKGTITDVPADAVEHLAGRRREGVEADLADVSGAKTPSAIRR